jgi:hypothetical protein
MVALLGWKLIRPDMSCKLPAAGTPVSAAALF